MQMSDPVPVDPTPAPLAAPAPEGSQQPAVPKISTTAIIALVCGVGAWLLLPVILAVVAVVLGARARKEIDDNPALTGRAEATVGMWLGITNIALSVIFLLLLILVVAASGGGGAPDAAHLG